jgi:ribosomal protein L37E
VKVSGAAQQLACPGCGKSYDRQRRFCADCGLPLTPGRREATISDAHRRARKIKPQLSEGQLVRVAGARHQAEAEFIQGLLLEEGIPSVLRRSAGFDVPDFLAAGPRDVLVPASGVIAAREVLLEAELLPAAAEPSVASPLRLLAVLVAALAMGALLVWVATQLAG